MLLRYPKVRVWREMDGDYTVANFLQVLGFSDETVARSIASIRAAKIRDLTELLELPTQRLRVR